MNALPVAERELRIASRRRATYWSRVVAAGIGLGTMCWIWLGEYFQNIPSSGARSFELLTLFSFAFCLLAGPVFSADSLANERRDGTLGLLFLTDLAGYDVVIGKLIATSFRAVYGFLAIIPVLAIPLILGGVSAGVFWRVIFALAALMFLSICISLFISSFCRKAGTAQILTILALALLSFPSSITYWIRPPSLLSRAWESQYVRNPEAFWVNEVAVILLAVVALVSACLILPRTVRLSGWREALDSTLSAWMAKGRWNSNASGQVARSRNDASRRQLEKNPFCWLVLWSGWPRFWLWVALGVVTVAVFPLAPALGGFLGGAGLTALVIGVLQLILKVWTAFEASQRFVEDRENGTLELVRGSGLTAKEILAGYREALRRRLIAPVIIVFALSIFLALLLYREPVALLPIAGSMGFLALDLYTLGWSGMWFGLSSRRPTRAALITLFRAVVVPLLVYVGLLLIAGVHFTGSFELITAWFGISTLSNMFLWVEDWRGLHRDFDNYAFWRSTAFPPPDLKERADPPPEEEFSWELKTEH